MHSARALHEQYLHSALQSPLVPLKHLLQHVVTQLSTVKTTLKGFSGDFSSFKQIFLKEKHTKNHA